MVVLTKASILQGVSTPKQTFIKALGGELWLRPLSSAELDESSYIEAKGMGNVDQSTKGKAGSNANNADVNQSNKLNVEKVTRAQDEAKYYRIFHSLDNEKNESDPWTLEEIKQLLQSATDEIDEKVHELSGVGITTGDVKQFPEN